MTDSVTSTLNPPEMNPSPAGDEQVSARSLLSPGKMAVQAILWVAGLALLVWIIKGATDKGDWKSLQHADARLVAVLLGCTFISAILNGTTFWITVQSLRPARFIDMQMLNVVANTLNYLPVRLGALLRVMYHVRVDRLTLLQIGAWWALIGYILLLGIGACVASSLVHDRVDLVWFSLVFGLMILGALAVRVMGGIEFVARHGRGIDRMATDPRGLWGAVILRVLDLAAFTGRMAAAMAILDIHVPMSHAVILATVALASSLTPLGRVGVREALVSLFAANLPGAEVIDDGVWKQLALIDSAGEAAVYIPLGVLGALWVRKRWKEGGKKPVTS